MPETSHFKKKNLKPSTKTQEFLIKVNGNVFNFMPFPEPFPLREFLQHCKPDFFIYSSRFHFNNSAETDDAQTDALLRCCYLLLSKTNCVIQFLKQFHGEEWRREALNDLKWSQVGCGWKDRNWKNKIWKRTIQAFIPLFRYLIPSHTSFAFKAPAYYLGLYEARRVCKSPSTTIHSAEQAKSKKALKRLKIFGEDGKSHKILQLSDKSLFSHRFCRKIAFF